MATHSSTLAQRIPWTEEPDKLQSIGEVQKVGKSEATKQQQQQEPMFMGEPIN